MVRPPGDRAARRQEALRRSLPRDRGGEGQVARDPSARRREMAASRGCARSIGPRSWTRPSRGRAARADLTARYGPTTPGRGRSRSRCARSPRTRARSCATGSVARGATKTASSWGWWPSPPAASTAPPLLASLPLWAAPIRPTADVSSTARASRAGARRSRARPVARSSATRGRRPTPERPRGNELISGARRGCARRSRARTRRRRGSSSGTSGRDRRRGSPCR
jgi:hypothetical protein